MKCKTHCLFIVSSLIFILFFQGTKKPSKVFFDGIYQTAIQVKDGDTTRSYLRFYADQTVIGVTSTGTATDLKDWFNKEEIGKQQIGKYTVTGKSIAFNIGISPKDVEYKGSIKGKKLKLDIHSNINGFKSTKNYTFVKIIGLK